MKLTDIIAKGGLLPAYAMDAFNKERGRRREVEDLLASLQEQQTGATPTTSTPGMKKGGKVKSASARADGIAIRGKTRA